MQNGKSLYYQKRFPTRLKNHPAIAGKANYKIRLSAKIDDPVALASEIQEINNSFDKYIETLSLANEHILTEVDLHQRAEAFLKMNNLKKGLLALSSDEILNDELKQTILEQGYFEDLDHHKWLSDPEKRIQFPPNPSKLVKVQQHAWKLLNTPIAKQPKVFLLSDCWKYYCSIKDIEELNRSNNRSHRPWNKFVSLGGGDTILTQETVNDYLDLYVKERRNEVAKATVERELNVITAALRLINDTKRIGLNISKPRIDIKHFSKAKPSLTHDEQIMLIEHASNLNNRTYKPWKELFILLAIQTGAHASELKTLSDENLHLNHEVPYITLNSGDGEGKTADRARYVPIVLHLDSIKKLIKDGALNELSEKSTDNISNQIKRFMKPILEKSSAYSLRHTLKHNCDIAGIDASVIASIGGWSGKSDNLSQHMLGYGRASREVTERLRALQRAQNRILAHLLPLNENNVTQIRSGANRRV